MMPPRVLFLDCETQSAASIKNVLEYVNHPSTRVLSAVGRIDGIDTVWIPPGRGPLVADTKPSEPPFPTDVPWVAHNAYGFDALIWNRLYPNHKPAQWIDTIPLCRAARLPASLEKVARELFNEGKSEHGKQVIEALCTAKYVSGKIWYPVGTPNLWRLLIEYNIRDVHLLERVWNVVAPLFSEWELLQLDWKINSRGIRFDKKLLHEILRMWREVQSDAFAYIADITGGDLSGTDLRSNVKVHKFLQSKGVCINSLNKNQLAEELEAFDDEEIDPVVMEVLRARQTVTRGSKGKVERLIEVAAVTDDRLRHSLVFHGAYTGRWSGRGIQPHNLARPTDPERMNRVLAHFESTGVLAANVLGNNPDDTLTELMRPVFCASEGKYLLIGDYAAIEARGLAWLSGELSQLRIFNDDKRDAYKEMASILFGVSVDSVSKLQRQVGKVVVLGSGYGMSGPKLDMYCKMAKPRIDLAALGLDPKAVIKTYRDSVPHITKFWRTLEDFALATVTDGKYRRKEDYGPRLNFYMRGRDFILQLPSKRELIYRNAKIEMLVPAFVKLYGMVPFTKPTITFDHPHGYRKSLYGGLLAENVTQAVCRDILAEALIRVDRSELDIVLHVHDEIICETHWKEHAEVLAQIMLQGPAWAAGFPIKVECHASKRYTK